MLRQQLKSTRLYRLYPWWLQEVAATCWAQSLSQTEMAKLHGDPFYMRRHGTTDSGRFRKPSNFEGTQAWPVPFGDPEGVGQRIFWSQDALIRAPLARNPPFGHPGKLARRPLCQAEKNFAWWEGKQTRGNDAVQWGFKQQIMGIQSISKDERNSGANCSCGSMQLTMFPFSKSCSIDVEGCYRWYGILLRGQVEG